MTYVWEPVIDDRLRPHVQHCAEAYSLTLGAVDAARHRLHDELDDALEGIRRHRATCDVCVVVEVMSS